MEDEVNKDSIIVLVTHSNYIDVCEDFIKLFNKNWVDCPFKLVCSIIGDNKIIDGVECIYAGEGKNLTDGIVAVINRYTAKYYMCFLGDAFITQKIDNEKVYTFLKYLDTDKIKYCRLITRYYEFKTIKNRPYRYIKSNDIYAHTFVAFVATKGFIDEELNGISDLDFEVKYLNKAVENNDFIYKDRVMLVQNLFHIVPGIVKGKWNRIALWKIKRRNKDITLTNRKKISVIEEIKIVTINFLQIWVSPKYRKKIKRVLRKVGISFTSES